VAAKKAANAAAKRNNIDWSEYFASIVSVCPWSKAYWSKQKIDICDWTNEIKQLGDNVARVYTYPTASDYKLNKLMKQFNKEREDEEWLYSHPKHGGHSTPIPVLIQQDFALLSKIREGLKK
tara:strand:- start:15254 stop:15619 length:366 start_codon:yes stop_codon:yes gene_type:complete